MAVVGEHNVDECDEKIAVVGRAEHRFEPGVAEKVHIDLGVEIAEFVFGEVDAEIVRAVFEETEKVFGAVAGDGCVVVYIVASIVRNPGGTGIFRRQRWKFLYHFH